MAAGKIENGPGRADAPTSAGETGAVARLLALHRSLQDLAARTPGDPGQVLALGSRELDLPLAVLARTRGADGVIVEALAEDAAAIIGATIPLSEARFAAIVAASQPLGFPDSAELNPLSIPSDPGLGLRSSLGVSLRISGEVWGVLIFGSRELRKDPFREEDKEIVSALGRHLEGVLAAQEELDSVVGALNEISRASGPEFFERLAMTAAELLGAPYVLVAESLAGSPGRVRSTAYWNRDHFAESIEYDVAGTPCEETLDNRLFHISDGVQERFPSDGRLRSLGIRSYLGGAITDGKGSVVGHIALFYTLPVQRSLRREGLLRVIAARATAGFARARAERELREQRQLFDFAASAGHIGIWNMDLESETLEMDRNAREMLGLSNTTGDLLEAWRTATYPEDRERVLESVQAAMRGETDGYTTEHRIRKPDDSTRWILIRGRVVFGPSGKALRIVGAGFDVTDQRRLEDERRQLEAKVQQAQRLESLGVLAGGLAHDFNNLLMGTLGNAELARREVEPDSSIDRRLVEIETASRRAAELTGQMLAYSGQASFTADSFDLNALVEEMTRLLQTVVSKKASFRLELAEDPVFIEADVAQVRQVVMNLITNSSDALSEQPGEVNLSTGLRHFGRSELSEMVPDGDLPEGSYAFLEIADTGVGMDEYTQARVYDPFFSTKFTGRGLGLAVVLGIMRSHGGGIRIRSAPGEGTSALVLLQPADVESDYAAMLEGGPEADADWEGQGAVLVVDDEEMVRDLMETVLEDAGFEVLTANDGLQALDVFEANADRVRLILLDMMMPGMNGQEVYAAIRAKRPNASIVLMSGFSEEHVTRGIRDQGPRFLKKPFEITALLHTVQDVLDS